MKQTNKAYPSLHSMWLNKYGDYHLSKLRGEERGSSLLLLLLHKNSYNTQIISAVPMYIYRVYT